MLAISLACGLVLRVAGSGLNNQVAITAMFMLYLGASPRAETVGVARIWETALGAAVAFAVSALVWPPNPLAEAHRQVTELKRLLDDDLGSVAEQLAHPDAERAEDMLELVREHSLLAIKEVLALEQAERALRWNPRKRGDAAAFTAQRGRLTATARQYRHLRTLARSVADVAEQRRPLPEPERDRLVRAVELLHRPDGRQIQSVPLLLNASWLHDPRAIAMALKLVQMSEDLVVAPPESVA